MSLHQLKPAHEVIRPESKQMTPTSTVVAVAALLWLILPMNVQGARLSWLSVEYWLAQVAFGFAGLSLLLGMANVGQDDGSSALRLVCPAVVGAAAVLVNLGQRPTINVAGLLLLAFFIPAIGFALSGQSSGMLLLSLATFAPAIIVPIAGYSAENLQSGLRDSARLTMVTLLGIVTMAPELIIGPCRGDKCSLWGAALGPLGTGNAFGMYLAYLAGVSIILARSHGGAILCIVASGVLVDASSSRSAILAWTLTVAIAFAWRLKRSALRIGLLRVLLVGTAAAVVTVAIFPWRPEDFTFRGNLWIVARAEFMKSPIFGHGPSFWVQQDRTTYVDANYATHNLILEIVVSAGILGLVALTLSLVFLLRTEEPRLHGTTTVLLSVWLAGSIFEVTAAPGRPYLWSGALLLVYLYGQSRVRNGGERRRLQVQGIGQTTRSLP